MKNKHPYTNTSYLDFRDRGLLLINKYWTKCSRWLGWRDDFKSFLTNNGRKSTTQKTKDWASRSPLKTRGEMEGTSPCSSSVTLAINPIINYEIFHLYVATFQHHMHMEYAIPDFWFLSGFPW
jgi:hypothetical protein